LKTIVYAMVLGLALPFVWFASEWLRHFWFLWFITDQGFPVYFRLLYGGALIDWGLCFALFFAVGAAVAIPVRDQRPVFWAICFGVAYSLMRVAIGRIWVPPYDETFVTVWAWGLYFVPPIGTALGALVSKAVTARWHLTTQSSGPPGLY
jgi:hypothetical protein